MFLWKLIIKMHLQTNVFDIFDQFTIMLVYMIIITASAKDYLISINIHLSYSSISLEKI